MNNLIMKKSRIIFFLLFICIAGYSQNYQWTKILNTDIATKTAIDGQNNLYLTGVIHRTQDFDPGVGIASLTPIYSSLNYGDAFFAKYDSLGNFLWVKTIKSNNKEVINDITVDASGNIYLTGEFMGTVDFGGVSMGSGDPYYSDLFFAKYDSNGNCLWAHQLTSLANHNESGTAIEVDVAGNVYVSGTISDSETDLDPGSGVSPYTFFADNNCIFAKYSPSGNYIWGTNYNLRGINDIAVSGSNVYWAGTYCYTVDFDPSAGTTALTSPASLPASFFCNINTSGIFQWVKSLSVDKIDKLFTDATGNLYVDGYVPTGADFDPGPGTAYVAGVSFVTNIYFAKYNSSGTYLWAKVIDGDGNVAGTKFSMDASGNTYIGRTDVSGVGGNDLDPSGANVYISDCDQHAMFAYITKYNSSGNYVWSDIMSGDDYVVAGVACTNSGSVYLLGGFSTPIDVYPGSGTYNIYNNDPLGWPSCFISKYSPQASSVIIPAQPAALVVSELNPYQLSVSFTDNSTNETGFIVERSVSGGSWVMRDTLNANVVTMLDSVNPFLVSRYVYRVKAFNATSYSCYSDTSGYTLNEFPLPVTGIVGDNTIPGQITLTWTDNSSNETFFQIARSGGFTDTVNANITTYIDTTDLISGENYYYDVRAFNAFSGVLSGAGIYIQVTGIPAVPTLLSVTSPVAYATALYFSNVSNNEDGFIIERKSLTGAWTIVDSVPGTAGYYYSYPDAGLIAGEYYTYRLSAYNSYGSSAYSDTAGALVSTIYAPGNMLALNYYTPYQIYVFWDDLSNNEDGFVIERKSDASSLWVVQDTVAMDEISYFDSVGLAIGNLYTYRVYAYNSSDRSSYSDTMQTFVESSILAPTNLVLSANYIDSTITLSWLDNSLVEFGYVIQRKTSLGSWMSIDTVPANSTTYFDNNLQPLTTFTYRVYGYNATDTSVYSNIDSLMGNFAPTAITLADGLDGSIIINWIDNSTNENGFTIEYSQDAGLTWTFQGFVVPDQTSFVHYGPVYTSDIYYLYRIKAMYGSGVDYALSDTVGISYSFPYLTAVWPGDVNHDSIVNSNDLLPIGLYYSQTGIPRDVQDILWQPHGSWDWNSTQVNGSNLKHIDSDGNGLINSNDTLAIAANFTLTHAIAKPTEMYDRLIAPDIYLVPMSSSYNAGDSVTVEVFLGSASFPVSDLYGISFTINYDGSLVVPGTEKVNFINSWFAIPGLNSLEISKADGLANSCYNAITRVNHTNASGFGKIANYTFILKSTILSTTSMVFSISDYEANNASGSPVLFNSTADSIFVTPLITGLNKSEIGEDIRVYPNPFNSQTTLSFNTDVKNVSIKIIDSAGNEVRKAFFSGKELIIQKGELKDGIYCIKIVFVDGRVCLKKIIIQ